jgi:hypothetical protein
MMVLPKTCAKEHAVRNRQQITRMLSSFFLIPKRANPTRLEAYLDKRPLKLLVKLQLVDHRNRVGAVRVGDVLRITQTVHGHESDPSAALVWRKPVHVLQNTGSNIIRINNDMEQAAKKSMNRVTMIREMSVRTNR